MKPSCPKSGGQAPVGSASFHRHSLGSVVFISLLERMKVSHYRWASDSHTQNEPASVYVVLRPIACRQVAASETPCHRSSMARGIAMGIALVLTVFFATICRGVQERSRIDRHALVTRHNVIVTQAVTDSVLQVGNGEIAFGVDITGLQTTAGNTMSQWGWHSFPSPQRMCPEDLHLEEYETYGRRVGYPTSSKGQETLYKWMRENPHRFNLGRLRVLLDGEPVPLSALTSVRQELDLWTGLVVSTYTLDGQVVRVETCAHPTRDLLAVRLESLLFRAGRLAIELSFPYGDPGTSGANWEKPLAHTTALRRVGAHQAEFRRQLDAERYTAILAWAGKITLCEQQNHVFILAPARNARAMEFATEFRLRSDGQRLPDFSGVKRAAAQHWPGFWNSGGAIDLSGSTDPRWQELERRIVLSQYLLAVNEAGSLPPQESGLYSNGWNGKFHLEMHWWHGAHYALWNRWPLFERSLDWYFRLLPAARHLAECQGYRGARWPKMVGPDGCNSPSPVGPLLIWQQPHPIFYAELDYRLHPSHKTLGKWKDLVFETADFMASFAVFAQDTDRFVLGPPLKTVAENTSARETLNPTFELSYWRMGLRLAQNWRSRLHMPPDPEWEKVLKGLAPLPVSDGLYLQQEGATNTFTTLNWEHPSLIGPLGMLPGDGVDPAVMRATVRKVMGAWQWDRTWGWDFPMMAMAAARNHEPALALEALLHTSGKNSYSQFGLSSGGPFPYFPSNGGLLYAAAMMARGWDGAPPGPAPGFPADGRWSVKFEGLNPAP
ncbi:MAG: hypothetical protein WCL11_08880 [Verrucomicrobiota bacterium]